MNLGKSQDARLKYKYQLHLYKLAKAIKNGKLKTMYNSIKYETFRYNLVKYVLKL